MAQRKTNQQIVNQMMNFSKFGALSEMFIMEAIIQYARECLVEDPAVFDSGLLNGAAWVGVAKEIHGKLEAHFTS